MIEKVTITYQENTKQDSNVNKVCRQLSKWGREIFETR